MKICWDMLEGVYLTRSGTFRKEADIYVYKEVCAKCGEPYLTIKSRQSKFCSHSCAMSGENNINYGINLSKEHKKKIAIANAGKTFSVETRKKIANSVSGSLHPNYKGGVTKAGLVTYDGYKNTLGPYEEICRQTNTEILEVKCAYCGKWFSPTRNAVISRLAAINNLNKGEQRLYCSENCKQACPTYNMTQYPKGFKKATSREVSTYLRKIVLKRDNWTCQKCGKTIKEAALHCHHIKGYTQNKILANDVDNCITLCKNCHKEIHKQKGCRYVDLQCK